MRLSFGLMLKIVARPPTTTIARIGQCRPVRRFGIVTFVIASTTQSPASTSAPIIRTVNFETP